MLATFSPFLGVMKFESEPLGLDNWTRLGRLAVTWVQDAGGFAMVGLVLWVIHGTIYPQYEIGPDGKKRNRLVGNGMLLGLALGVMLYLIALGVLTTLSDQSDSAPRSPFLGFNMTVREKILDFLMMGAGTVALVAFGGPFVRDLFRMRSSRIYALAKLSFKEAVRRRVVWVFLGVLVLYLFPARWFFSVKAEDELKSVIGQTTRGMNILLISVGLLLAAFSIPSDIKNLTIHTVTTKPVERFEIVLGKFFGYLGLLTGALGLMTALGLVLINLGTVSEEAADESFKAREVRYGRLEFRAKQADFTGVDVGREDAYRRYIAGLSSQRAIWLFDELPSSFGDKDSVPLEFAFDIYRTTKGEEGNGVSVSFEVITHQWDPKKKVADPDNPGVEIESEQLFVRQSQGLGNPRPGDPNWAKVNALAEQHGRYTFNGKQIFDYHTTSIAVPAGLFKNALAGTPQMRTDGTGGRRSRLGVVVKCDSPSQFIGVARYDLYLLKSEGNFSLNYFKGAMGLWFRLVIAITIAVVLSTYLSGVLSFLTAMFVFIGGFFLDFIQELARGTNVGGGPLESFAKLVKSSTPTAELDPTPTTKALQSFDGIFRWLLRRVTDIIPDVDSYGMSDFVAQGFNIDLSYLGLNLVVLLAYILPWLVVSYYLMKAREIAA